MINGEWILRTLLPVLFFGIASHRRHRTVIPHQPQPLPIILEKHGYIGRPMHMTCHDGVAVGGVWKLSICNNDWDPRVHGSVGMYLGLDLS